MNKDEIVYQMEMKILLLNHELYQGKKKTKRDEAVLRGKIEELRNMIDLIETLSKQETA